MIGKTSLTEKEKEVLRDMVKRTCQNCEKNESEVGTLDIHRITRGNKGGLYVPNNIKCVCKRCHRIFHQMEFK